MQWRSVSPWVRQTVAEWKAGNFALAAARERPDAPEQIIEVIAAYVAASFAPRS